MQAGRQAGRQAGSRRSVRLHAFEKASAERHSSVLHLRHLQLCWECGVWVCQQAPVQLFAVGMGLSE
jgi:hypothetical protein